MASRVNFLPRDGAPGHLLPWVIAIMVFISGIALSAAIILSEASAGWQHQASRSLTVQVAATGSEESERQTGAALAVLGTFPGIESARRLSADEIAALLAPWLGAGNLTGDLPIPQVIDVIAAADRAPDLARLAEALAKVAPDARLDDHGQWLGRISQLVRTLQWLAASAALLIALVTVAIVIFATRAGLAVHAGIIEIVHLMGAPDRMIAGEFQWRFLLLGLKGGVAGTLLAAITLFGLQTLTAGMESAFLPEIHFNARIIGALVFLPIATALVSMLTTLVTVRRALSKLV